MIISVVQWYGVHHWCGMLQFDSRRSHIGDLTLSYAFPLLREKGGGRG